MQYLSTLWAFRSTLTMWASWFAQFFRTWNRQLLHLFHQQLIATNCSQEEVFLSCFDSFWFSVLSSVSRSPSVSFHLRYFLFCFLSPLFLLSFKLLCFLLNLSLLLYFQLLQKVSICNALSSGGEPPRFLLFLCLGFGGTGPGIPRRKAMTSVVTTRPGLAACLGIVSF